MGLLGIEPRAAGPGRKCANHLTLPPDQIFVVPCLISKLVGEHGVPVADDEQPDFRQRPESLKRRLEQPSPRFPLNLRSEEPGDQPWRRLDGRAADRQEESVGQAAEDDLVLRHPVEGV